MSPELCKKKEYSGPASDTWAAGVVLYTLLFGTQPFKARTEVELFKAINLGHFQFPKSSHPDFYTSEQKAAENARKMLNQAQGHQLPVPLPKGAQTKSIRRPHLLTGALRSSSNTGIHNTGSHSAKFGLLNNRRTVSPGAAVTTRIMAMSPVGRGAYGIGSHHSGTDPFVSTIHYSVKVKNLIK